MILEMVYAPPVQEVERSEERGRLVIAPAALAVVVLLLGIYLPRPLTDALSSAAIELGGRAP
jgi:hypothetical protein